MMRVLAGVVSVWSIQCGVVSSVRAVGGEADYVLDITSQPGLVIQDALSVVRIICADGVRYMELTLTRPTL